MKLIPTKIKQQIFYILGNLQFSIFILLIIALVISIGTILEQDKNQIFYEANYGNKNPFLGFVNSQWILFLGLDHIYTTKWFFSLITIFGFSLISCTGIRQIPSLKLATLWKFIEQGKYKQKNGITLELKKTSLTKFSYILRKKNYNLIQQGTYLYAYKGLCGKISPILVHVSIITILIGTIASTITGFTIQELVPKNELFHPQNTVFTGPVSYVKQNFEVYVKDFKITYTDSGNIDQFYSDLVILNNNLNTIFRKIIFVNEPLKYREMTFYQTDWNISRLQTLIQNKPVENKLPNFITKNSSKLWIGNLKSDENVIIMVQDLTGKYLLYTSKKKCLGIGHIGSKILLKGINTRILTLVPSTGLQIKSDSGINTVYLGFLTLIPSIIISYISYSQIWGIKKGGNIYVYANTNRAIYFFEKSVMKIVTILKPK